MKDTQKKKNGIFSSFLSEEEDDETVTEVENAGDGALRINCRIITEFRDVSDVVSYLKANYPVVINLQQSNELVLTRSIDYIAGALSAIDGHLTQVGDRMWLCSPNGIEVECAFDPNQVQTSAEDIEQVRNHGREKVKSKGLSVDLMSVHQ